MFSLVDALTPIVCIREEIEPCEICQGPFCNCGKEDPLERKEDDDCYRCLECRKSYQHAGNLSRHITTFHLGMKIEERYTCYICYEVLQSKEAYKLHFLLHPNVRPYVCPICLDSFTRIGLRDLHLSTHDNTELKHKCEQCKASFKDKYVLKIHSESHMENKSNFCKECGRIFKNESALNVHVMRMHPKKEETYVCKQCKDVFTTMQELKLHEFKLHQQYNHTCGQCGQAFTKQEYLQEHLEEHSRPNKNVKSQTKQRPHKRKKSSKHKNNLNLKKAKCQKCRKEFKNEKLLKVHLKLHENIHVCTVCNISFEKLISLEKHSLTHTKKHTCLNCKESFDSETKLNSHQKKHSFKGGHKCKVCKQIFRRKVMLDKHLVEVHK